MGQLVLSDQKKFNIDCPDGFYLYFHDLHKQKKAFQSVRMNNRLQFFEIVFLRRTSK